MTKNRDLAPDLPPPSGSGHLAIVGGGPSILGKLDRLRAWEGDIWAINGTWRWLHDRGIDAWFFTADPMAENAELVVGATRGILAPHCDPSVFAAIKGDVRKIKGSCPGPTSAVSASSVALDAGYAKATYFGCESSYDKTTHVYDCPIPTDLVRVDCGGRSFLTKLEFILQAEQLADVLRTFPRLFAEECGGFLSALVEHGDWDVTQVPRAMYEQIAAQRAA